MYYIQADKNFLNASYINLNNKAMMKFKQTVVVEIKSKHSATHHATQ